jgi:hypothetical protein
VSKIEFAADISHNMKNNVAVVELMKKRKTLRQLRAFDTPMNACTVRGRRVDDMSLRIVGLHAFFRSDYCNLTPEQSAVYAHIREYEGQAAEQPERDQLRQRAIVPVYAMIPVRKALLTFDAFRQSIPKCNFTVIDNGSASHTEPRSWTGNQETTGILNASSLVPRDSCVLSGDQYNLLRALLNTA